MHLDVFVTLRNAFKRPAMLLIALFGLSVGIATVIALITFVLQEFSYDDWIANSDHIFRVETAEVYPGRSPLEIARAPGPLALAMDERFVEIDSITRGFVAAIEIERDDEIYAQEAFAVDPNFFDVFAFEIIESSGSSILENVNSLAIARSVARRLFPDRAAIGETISLRLPEQVDFTVSAVFEDIPRNSHFDIEMVMTHDAYFRDPEDDGTAFIPEQWGGAYFHTYFNLKESADPDLIRSGMDDLIDERLPDDLAEAIGVSPHEFFNFQIRNLKDIHLQGFKLAAMKSGGNQTLLFFFVCAAVLVLTIAILNFGAIVTARLLARRREMAVRRTVGANGSDLLSLILVETGAHLFPTAIISVFWLQLINYMDDHYFGNVLFGSLTAEPVTIVLLLMVLLIVGVLAVIIPVANAASTNPKLSLYSGRSDTSKGGFANAGLLIFQLSVAISLIAIALVVVQQIKFMSQRDVGFDESSIVSFRVPNVKNTGLDPILFAERLERMDGLDFVTVSSSVPFIPEAASEANVAALPPGYDKPVILGAYQISPNFFDTYEIDVVAGRLFSDDYQGDLIQSDRDEASIVINEAVRKRLGYKSPAEALNNIIDVSGIQAEIIGVIPNVRFRSARQGARDEIFFARAQPGQWVSVRFKKGWLERVSQMVAQEFRAAYPSRQPNVQSLRQAFQNTYQAEQRQFHLLVFFTLAVVLLALMGLFAAAAQSTHIRKKEMAVRLVLGAQTLHIVTAFTKQYTAAFAVASLISIPLVWWASVRWLELFADRINLSPVPFVASIVVVGMLAILVVGYFITRLITLPVTIILEAD